MSKLKRNTLRDIITRTRKLNYDWWLLGAVTVLTVLGLAFLASSLSTNADYTEQFLKQLILGVGIGSILTFVLARFDYHKIFAASGWLVFLNFLLLGYIGFFALYISLTDSTAIISSVSSLPIKPHMANGAVRWISFNGLPLPNFQPSELTKFALLAYFASYFNKFEASELNWDILKKPIYVFALSALLIVIQPDLGTVVLLYIIIFCAMWIGKSPEAILTYSTIVVTTLALLMIILTPFRSERIDAFLNQDSDSSAADQIRGVQRAVANGKIFGRGYGESQFKQRTGVLYEQSTDAIIAIIGEESGFLGILLFLALYLVIFWRGIDIASGAPDNGGKVMATGIVIWITFQTVINIAGMTRLLPLTGIPLPFVSLGGSSMVLNLASIGVLLNISKYSEVNKARSKKPKPAKHKLRSANI